jgi:hypothetical protein
LTGLPINQLNKLLLLDCSFNSINSLTLTSNPNLETLFCGNNKFISLATQPTTINLSNNTKLAQFFAPNNDLTHLDFSNNPNIFQIIVTNNKLISLNVANGNNTNISNFDASINNSLGCITVDTGFTPTTWIKDNTTTFSDNCATASVNDVFLENIVEIYPNPTKSTIKVNSPLGLKIKSIRIFNYIGEKVLETDSKDMVVNQLSNGVYFVNINFYNNKSVYKKVIKQ